MKQARSISSRAIVKLAVATVAFAAATGAAFAAWVDNGAQIFLAMAASGLAWCF